MLHLQRKVGESVDGTTATPIAEVADLRVLELHAQAPPAALRPLRDGMRATIQVLGSDAPIAGTVARVAPAVDPATMLGLVRIALASADGIQVGTAATGRISFRQRPGVRVPASALRRSLIGEDEVVVCAGGTAHVRKVEIGSRGDQGVEIKDGLKAGEQVVVDHVLGLQDEQPLTAPDKTTADKPGTRKASDDKAGDDKAGDDKGNHKAGGKNADDKTGHDQAGTGKDDDEKGGTDKPGAARPSADKAGADKAGADKAAPAPGSAKKGSAEP